MYDSCGFWTSNREEKGASKKGKNKQGIVERGGKEMAKTFLGELDEIKSMSKMESEGRKNGKEGAKKRLTRS